MARKGAQRAAKVVPAMRYRDVAAAAEWLCTAFGFEKHALVKGEDGAVAMAQLTVGATMIMLLPVGGSELDPLMKQPDEIGGAETQKCYLVVDDIDFHYAKAKAQGARLVLDLKEYENGGRGFSCRDPEGHIWSFGTYDPWDGKFVAPDPPPAAEPLPRGRRGAALTMAAMVAVAVVVATGAGWMLGTAQQPTPPDAALQLRLKQELTLWQQRAQQAAERAARDGAELQKERSAREGLERSAQQAREGLARGESAKEAAQRTAKQLEAQLIEERRARETAERVAQQSRDELARGDGAKDAAQRTAKQLEAQLIEERRAREAAERVAQQARDELARGDSAKAAVSGATKQMETQLAEERRAKEAAERAARAAADQIGRERTAKQVAQNATLVVQKELALARAARQLAEKTAKEATEQLARERAERAAKEAQVKSGQAQGADKSVTQPTNADRASRKVSKKSREPGAAEPMPPLLP